VAAAAAAAAAEDVGVGGVGVDVAGVAGCGAYDGSLRKFAASGDATVV
jgi:hypothetical protein